MTKWFTYYADKPHWSEEEFFEYFGDKDEFDIFSSFLKTSYEMTVLNDVIWKITAVVSEGKAEYRIVLNDGYVYPAGTGTCMSASELWNGFMVRLDEPSKYVKKEERKEIEVNFDAFVDEYEDNADDEPAWLYCPLFTDYNECDDNKDCPHTGCPLHE